MILFYIIIYLLVIGFAMSVVDRKIGYYSIQIKNKKGENQTEEIFPKLLATIRQLDEKERMFESKGTNKFHLLETISNREKNIQFLIFSSAKYKHRPPLINKDDASRRDNPKTMSEGEEEKTHIYIKALEDEILLIKEERRSGIAISTICAYFRSFLHLVSEDQDLYVVNYLIGNQDFLTELKSLGRAQKTTIYVEKKVIGSEFLNYSDSISNIQEDIEITLRAKRHTSLADITKSVFLKFGGGDSEISRIRVEGISTDKNKLVLDTSFLRKTEYINVDIDDATGIITAKEIKKELKKLIEEL